MLHSDCAENTLGSVGCVGLCATRSTDAKLSPVRHTAQNVRDSRRAVRSTKGNSKSDRRVSCPSVRVGWSLVELRGHALLQRRAGNCLPRCRAAVQFTRKLRCRKLEHDPVPHDASGLCRRQLPVRGVPVSRQHWVYSFYEGEVGTFCTKSKTAYITVQVLGTYGINGPALANDTGSTEYRYSCWYGIAGVTWLVYRALMIRRSYVTCKRYGRKCDELGEKLNQQEAMVFVQESLRLTAHGATNYQRTALLYLIVEGIMTDLFLIIANDGWTSRVQYASMGYNLSGLMLLLFEMMESMRWLSERWRLRIKRTFFSYETALVGELASALLFQTFLSGLNGSDLKRSKPTALAMSYYFWSLICHAIVVVSVVSIISTVRVPWAVMYVWFKHNSLAILSEPCCIDTVLGVRSRIMLLGGYRWEDGKLYYHPAALKAFGMLKMEEDGVEYLILHKLQWFTVPANNLMGIGVITGPRVEPCNERPCTGIVSFLDRRLGVLRTKRIAISVRHPTEQSEF